MVRPLSCTEQLDHVLVGSKNLKEKQEIKKEEVKEVKRDENKMEISFEPKDKA